MSEIESQVRALIDKSVTCKMRPQGESLEALGLELLELKAKIKAYNKMKREGVLSFGQALELSCFKINLRGLENQIAFREMQEMQGTNGPVRLT